MATQTIVPSDPALEINFTPHSLGDRWQGCYFGPIRFFVESLDDEVIPVPTGPLTRVSFIFTKGKQRFLIDSDVNFNPDAPVVIVNADTWLGYIDEVEDFLPVSGIWDWVGRFYQEGRNGPQTHYKGTIEVTANGSSTNRAVYGSYVPVGLVEIFNEGF